jgi:hypothetical protein
MEEKTRIQNAVEFIQRNYDKEIQIFDTRNLVGDPMECVYSEDGIDIDECYRYEYLEIFGLTEEEKAIMRETFKGAEF